MTVAELIEKLEKTDQNYEVVVQQALSSDIFNITLVYRNQQDYIVFTNEEEIEETL